MLCNQYGMEESDCAKLLCELSCLVFQGFTQLIVDSLRSFSQQGCNKTGVEGFFGLENRGLGGIVYSQAYFPPVLSHRDEIRKKCQMAFIICKLS